MGKSNITGATIPYQLRPHKAIERNLFLELLKKLDAANPIDLSNYRYVGFGAAFLEDFKAFHLELNLKQMDSIEMNDFAYTRQVFNNPYYFLNLFHQSSTDYITENFKNDINQIIWLDYVNNDLRQQLLDIELLCAKVNNLDVLKLTFNTKAASFIFANNVLNISDPSRRCKETDIKSILKFLNDDATYQFYISGKLKVKDVKTFSEIVRTMAVRAINRGLAKNANKELKFHHIAAFVYADGQEMSTLTGLFATSKEYKLILKQCKLKKWGFYKDIPKKTEVVIATEITVPVMTISERLEVDKRVPTDDLDEMARTLPFFYGTDEAEHKQLIEGYQTFYKYLPYYSKVTY